MIAPFNTLQHLYHPDAMLDCLAHVRACLADRMERGELGEKSGKGFYDYPHPLFRQAGFLADT